MRVLVVGGRSALAGAVIPVFSEFAEVLTAGRAGCDFELDLTWPADRFVLPGGVDAVINLASHFGGNQFAGMLAAEETNVIGTLKLVNASQQAGVSQFVHISSIFAGLTDDSSIRNIYAISKRHAEEVLQLYGSQVGLAVTILRPTRIYGEGEGFRRHQPFFYEMLDRAERGDDIVLYGHNDALRNFVHAEDVAETLACVVRQGIAGRFDCAHPENVTVSQVAKTAITAFGTTGSVRFDEARPDIADDNLAPDETLYRKIARFPHISLASGLAREAARRRALT